MVDIWRLQHADDKQFTWIRFAPELVMVRLDNILLSRALVKNITFSDILPSFKLDHRIPYIMIEFKSNARNRGPGFWRFNVSLLEDKEYVERVKEIINSEKQKKHQSVVHKWEYIKMTIRGFMIKYTARKKKSQINILNALERKIKNAEQDLVEGSKLFSKQEIMDHIVKLQNDRQEIIEYKQKGAAIRARQNWLELGEKMNSYFLKLECKNYNRKNRQQLRIGDKIITDNAKILQAQYEYYKELYTTEGTVISDEYLNSIQLPVLEGQEIEMLKSEITKEEIKHALWQLAPNKATGTQGIPPEFIHKFWPELHGILTQVIQTSSHDGLCINESRGIISLVEKSGKDELLIKNWRPLSLLNTDYKILSKLLAVRLNKVIPRIIHNDQSGFIKNRGLTDNIMNLLSLIELCETENIPVLLISFDYEKAFARVEWQVLFKILHRIGFPQEYISMIKAMYKNIQSCTVNNGYTSEYINITRSLRQGCPISSSLFVVLIEVLGQKLREDKGTVGILVNKHEKQHEQYADDIWTLIHANQNNLNNLMKTMYEFSMATGQKINYDKTQIVRIGSLRDSKAIYYVDKPIQWSEGTKILGIEITANRERMYRKNFEILYEKMTKVLNMWEGRSLTLIGRILVVNTLVTSLATQKLMCLPTPPDEYFSKIKKLVTNFI